MRTRAPVDAFDRQQICQFMVKLGVKFVSTITKSQWAVYLHTIYEERDYRTTTVFPFRKKTQTRRKKIKQQKHKMV